MERFNMWQWTKFTSTGEILSHFAMTKNFKTPKLTTVKGFLSLKMLMLIFQTKLLLCWIYPEKMSHPRMSTLHHSKATQKL
jgi:hypothetical protein